MKKLRGWQIKQLVQTFPVSQWQTWNLNFGHLAPEFMFLNRGTYFGWGDQEFFPEINFSYYVIDEKNPKLQIARGSAVLAEWTKGKNSLIEKKLEYSRSQQKASATRLQWALVIMEQDVRAGSFKEVYFILSEIQRCFTQGNELTAVQRMVWKG